MNYTSIFGVVPYDSVVSGVMNVPDLTKFATIPDNFKNNSVYYLTYSIKDGDRLDTIAKRIYDQEDRYWIIMLMNDMYDISNSWPLNEEEYQAMLEIKYPFNQPGDTHHREDSYGNVIDPYYAALKMGLDVNTYLAQAGLTIVTIDDYETALNEEKRNIKILDPSFVDDLENAITAAFSATQR